MSLQNFWRCCFPNTKEQIVSNKEESYDIVYSSKEKKLGYALTLKNIDAFKIETSNDYSEDVFNHSNNNTNIAELKTKKQIEGSFSSFRLAKKERSSITPKSNKTNNIKFNSKGNDENSFRRIEPPNKDTIKLNNNNSQISSIIKSKGIDESRVELVNSQRFLTDQQIMSAPILLLEEIEGNILKNNKLRINAAGLTTGLRKARDGIAFFGKSTKQNNQEYAINDFELNMDNANELGSHIFIIYYKKETNKYYIKGCRDRKNASHIQIMIDNQSEFPILTKEIILLNENYFEVSPLMESNLEIINLGTITGSSLKEKKTEEEFQGMKYYFNPSQYKTVTIGRDKECLISFTEDKSFSKVHASFNFDIENKIWKLKDGGIDRPSTNGTWIYATHSYEISDNMIFQVGECKLRLSTCE